MIENNPLWTQDAYKWTHKNMYLPDTEVVYSYFESRVGAMYQTTTFFGLQYLLKKWFLKPITKEMVNEAAEVADSFFDVKGCFDRKGWDYIVDNLEGKMPLSIKAVPEGVSVPTSNVLMTVENTDSKCWWLTNAMETLLCHVWSTSSVATRSKAIMDAVRKYFKLTSDNEFLANYFVQDFSQRGNSSMESAGILAAAHLVNGKGSDSMAAIPILTNYYNANPKEIGCSVKANEHSIACSLGKEKEFEVTKHLIKQYPQGILSVVSDSYSIVNAVKMYCTELKPLILSRSGKFIIRPDSPRFNGDTAWSQVLWIAEELWKGFGGFINTKGYKVLHPNVGIILGDSITETDIERTLSILAENRFSAETCVYGCGSYLSQKINRDTQRMAFKCSAQLRNGEWFDISKDPLDKSKASKKGRLKLIKGQNGYETVCINDPRPDELIEVYRDGKLLVDWTLEQVRNNTK